MNTWLPDALNIRSVRLGQVPAAEDPGRPGSLQRPGHLSNKRRHWRLPLRGRQILVYTRQSGRDVAFLVPTRTVSAGGLSFLHGQMMHVGTPCQVNLATRRRHGLRPSRAPWSAAATYGA